MTKPYKTYKDYDLGRLTGYQFSLSPFKGKILQVGSIMINDFEDARCEADLEGNIIITHIIGSNEK